MATAEFKKAVIETMQEERQSYSETAHRFEINDHKRICCTISDRPVLSMVTSMLDKAFDKLPDGTNLIRIKAKLKGLPPAFYRQQALSAACTIPVPKLCLTFRGHFIFMTAGRFYDSSTSLFHSASCWITKRCPSLVIL